MELKDLFKQWCKETKRSGGVLVGASIQEFLEWANDRLVMDFHNKIRQEPFHTPISWMIRNLKDSEMMEIMKWLNKRYENKKQ